MTKLLEMAVEAARELSPEEQDEIARVIMQAIGETNDEDVYVLSPEEEAAIDKGIAELERGEYVTFDDVKKTLAKYRL